MSLSYSDDVEFRFAGNKVFRNGTQNLKVGEVYKEYMTGDLGTFYGQTELKRTSGGKLGTMPTMALELYIDRIAVCIVFRFWHSTACTSEHSDNYTQVIIIDMGLNIGLSRTPFDDDDED